MIPVCTVCELPTHGDDHWDDEREMWVCADHCPEPSCKIGGEAGSPDRDSAPGDLPDARHVAEVLAAAARTGVVR